MSPEFEKFLMEKIDSIFRILKILGMVFFLMFFLNFCVFPFI